MKTNPPALVSTRNLIQFRSQLVTLLWLALALPATATSLQLNFTVPSSFNESNRQAFLEWNAAPARTYLVQSATNLSSETAWKTEEAVRASTSGPVKWTAPEALGAQKYYRLVLPQPEVFSVEPAFVNSDDPGALFYLTGQCLPTNGTVVINGQSFSVTSFDTNGSWIALSLNGLPPGTPIIGSILVLDNASNIVTTLPLQNPVIYGAELTAELLQGPPDEPPSSPDALLAAWLSRKGYQYYMAKSDLNAAGLQNNPYFQENNNSGEMPEARGHHRGHVTVLKSHAEEPLDGSTRSSYHRGHVTVLKSHADAPDSSVGRHRGHVTVLKSHADGDGVTVLPATGELLCEETDFAIPGRGLDFVWTRTYRSRTGSTTGQGAGWDFSYNVSLSLQPDGTVLLRPGNGRADIFYPDGTNGWTRDAYFFVIHDVDQDGAPDQVVFPDGGKWILHPPGTAVAGKLAEIVDRNNNTIRCEYDPATRRLERVVDTVDRTNTIAYSSKGLIESVTDFSGRTVRYEYDSAADLIACISPAVIGTPNGNDFPGGKTNRYAYSSGNLDERLNHNLVSATDGLGQTWLQVNYETASDPTAQEFDRVRDYYCGTTTHFIVLPEPPTPANGFAATRVIINDGMGNVSESYYDSRHRLVREVEFTGRANPAAPTTDVSNRPTGKLRAEDPDYFETRWEWNADSLCTLEIRPDGGSTEISHQRAQDHNSSRSNKTASRAHDGNVRVVRERASSPVDTDGDGAPDTSELAWYYEYDPRFGSPPVGSTSARDRINELESKLQNLGLLSRTIGTRAILSGHSGGWSRVVTDRDSGRSKGFGFIISTTDPRGNSSTCDYDAQGNARRITFKAKEGATLARTLDFAYNAHGQLTAITNAADANGDRRVDTFSYYASGSQRGMLEVMVAVAMSGGLALTTMFEYDPHGNVTNVVDPRGNATMFTYNALDQLVAAETPPNSTYPVINWDVDLSYDANNNLVRVDEGNRDSSGVPDAANPQWSTLYEYDSLNRRTGVVREIDETPIGTSYATNRFSYGGNDNLVASHSPLAVAGLEPDNIATFEYDERGLLHRAIRAPANPAAATNEFSYNVNGYRVRTLHTSSIDDLNAPKLTALSYDGFDRLTGVTDAMGNLRQFTYDRNGNLIRERRYGELNDVVGTSSNLRLADTRYEYDSLNRLTRTVDSFFDIFTQTPLTDGESVTTFTYAPNGACTSSTDDNGHTTRYTYDPAGRLASSTDPKTNVVSYTYDECDNVLSIVQTDRSDLGGGQQFFVVSGYDRLHRLTRSVDNVGNTNRYAYDSRGYLTRHTDPKGNIQQFTAKGTGRTTGHIADINADGILDPVADVAVSYAYDANDRLTGITDDNGNTTTYAYDSLDRLVQVTAADGTISSLVWSPRSNLILHQDANGTVISNSFDLLDRCIRRDITLGSEVSASTTFESFAYDGFSRLVLASNDVSRIIYVYDSLGHPVQHVQDDLVTTSSFDGLGNHLSLTYPGGRLVTYGYDALNQVTNVSSGAGGLPPTSLVTYAYDGPDRVGRVSRANNVNTRVTWNGLVNPANAPGDFGFGQIRGINHQIAGAGAVIDRRIAAFDRNQNRTLRAQIAPFFNGGPLTTNTFGYDALDRLTEFSRGSGALDDWSRSYALDGNGNRQVVLSNGMVQTYVMDNTTPVPADFQMNQYTLTPFGDQAHDENGNLVARLAATGPTFYEYDYADRLVQVVGLNDEGAIAPLVSFSYDALGRRIRKIVNPGPTQTVIQYAVAAGGSVLEERVNGSLSRTYVLPQVGDEVLVAFNPEGQPQYYHRDDQGNTLALTDAVGTVIERYDYDDYGLPSFLTSEGEIIATNASPVGNPFLFHGLAWDAENKCYHQGSGSYFDPQTGRPTGRMNLDGGMPNRISMNVTVPKQTQGATFGEKVNAGLHAAGSALSQGHRSSSTKAQDHNSSRSNKTASIALPGGGAGGGSGGSKAQDHNSSRSNKTASTFDFGGGGGGGSGKLKHLLYTAKQGKTGSASGK
jgi:YD repeat-containing protein